MGIKRITGKYKKSIGNIGILKIKMILQDQSTFPTPVLFNDKFN